MRYILPVICLLKFWRKKQGHCKSKIVKICFNLTYFNLFQVSSWMTFNLVNEAGCKYTFAIALVEANYTRCDN